MKQTVMRYCSIGLLAILSIGVPFSGRAAEAESALVLTKFGLIGIWSPDCSKDISEPRGSRVAFSAPSTGMPTATTQEHRDALVTTVYDIESATADGDTIRMALHPVKISRSDGTAAPQTDYRNLTLVFQKMGDRIEVTRVQFEGLPEIQRQSIFEKCVG